jgi:hypothetical protein
MQWVADAIGFVDPNAPDPVDGSSCVDHPVSVPVVVLRGPAGSDLRNNAMRDILYDMLRQHLFVAENRAGL